MASIPYDNGYFDCVQSRLVNGGIDASRWDQYIREIKRVLVGHGWVQLMEVYWNAQCSSANYPDGQSVLIARHFNLCELMGG